MQAHVQCRLRSKEGYQEFLKTLNLYGQDVITRGELVMMVQDILARFSDIAVCLVIGPLASDIQAVDCNCPGLLNPKPLCPRCSF